MTRQAWIVQLDAWCVVEADTAKDAEVLARSVRHWEDYEVSSVLDVEREEAARERIEAEES